MFRGRKILYINQKKMLVANRFERVINKDFDDAGDLSPDEREEILNHIISFDGRWQDYDVLVNGAPKKGV